MANFYYDKQHVASAINIVRALPTFDKWRYKNMEVWLSDKKGGAGTRIILEAEDEYQGTYWVCAVINTYLDKDGNETRTHIPGTDIIKEQRTKKNMSPEEQIKWYKDKIISFLQKLK